VALGNLARSRLSGGQSWLKSRLRPQLAALQLALLACLLPPCALAQTASASLLGTVVDESSAVAPDVTVTAREESTGFTRGTVTNSEGSYAIEALLPGSYAVTAIKQGFRATAAEHVQLTVGQKALLDLKLYIGEERESVTATGTVSPVQTNDASTGYLFDSLTVEELPLDTRNLVALVTLGPGAIPRQLGGFTHDIINDVQQGSRGSVAFNPPINGSRSTMNAFVLDGASDTDRNTFAIAVYPPLESVEELRVQTSSASAEFPQAGGASIDVVTKSGSRQFHGSVFEFLQNEVPDARNYFDDPTLAAPIVRQNQFGGSLGGPMPVANTFFFATYEGLRSKIGSPVQSLVPPAQLRTGNFTGQDIVYDPLTLDATGARVPFPGDLIPSTRIDPIAANFLTQYQPLPNLNNGDGNNYVDQTPNTNRNDAFSTRIDHQFGNRSQLSARYTYNGEQNIVAGSFPLRPTDERVRAQQAALSYTCSGASWLNEARFSFTRMSMYDTPESAFQSNVIQQLGVEGLTANPANYGLPYFQLADYSLVTDDPTLPQVQRDNLWNLSDSVSWTRGAHTIKTGFDWIHFQLNYQQNELARGSYTYTGAFTSADGTPGPTGDALADFLLGFPQDTSRNEGNTQAYLRQNSFGGFVQDDWRVSPRLTLNFGLRYEYVTPYTETRGNLLNLVYAAGSNPPPPQLERVSQAVSPDTRNFAPRVGLAWRLPQLPFSKGEAVFRAGYGIYYSPEIAVEIYDLLLNGILVQNNITDGSQTPILTTRNGFPQTASTGLPTYFGIDPHAPTPYMQQWNAGFQHEFAGHVLGEVSYVGSKGTHLGRFRQFNTPLQTETGADLSPRPGDLQSLRTWPSLGEIIQRQHIANSSYNALQAKAEKRLTGHVSLLASFVWSKSIDDADTVIPGFYDSLGAQDENNLRLERGLSSFNVGRRISGGYVVGLPAVRAFGPVLRNWQLTGTVTLQDGMPLSIFYYAFDPANTGLPNRPNLVPGVSLTLPRSQRTTNAFYNTAAFTAPAPYTFGDAGRNIVNGPGNNLFDMALHRRFAIRERGALEFRAEAFNIFNHPNWGVPGTYADFGAPLFGGILGVGDPRRLQFAIRCDF
jgi:outer membrane receptor protein involved in Fe transport